MSIPLTPSQAHMHPLLLRRLKISEMANRTLRGSFNVHQWVLCLVWFPVFLRSIYILINVYECSWCEGNYFFRYESKYRKINKVYSRKFLYLKNRHKLVQSRQPISVVHYHPKIVWVSRTITTFSRMVPENPWTPPFPFHGGEFNTKSDLLPISTG